MKNCDLFNPFVHFKCDTQVVLQQYKIKYQSGVSIEAIYIGIAKDTLKHA